MVIVGGAGTYITIILSILTSPAAKSEEKPLFSQANSYTEARKLNGKDLWETDPSGRYDLAICFFFVLSH